MYAASNDLCIPLQKLDVCRYKMFKVFAATNV
jgi:hypothetical protein